MEVVRGLCEVGGLAAWAPVGVPEVVELHHFPDSAESAGVLGDPHPVGVWSVFQSETDGFPVDGGEEISGEASGVEEGLHFAGVDGLGDGLVTAGGNVSTVDLTEPGVLWSP